MVELVDELGYEAIRVRELTRLAGVSTRTFYEHFPTGKGECFLSTFELIAQGLWERIELAQKGDHEWQERLRLAFLAFMEEIERRPQTARFAFVDSLTAGAASLEHVRLAEGTFETMFAESFARAPGKAVVVPPLLVGGIVAGIGSVVRDRLLDGLESELSGLTDELVTWTLSFRDRTAVELQGPDTSVPGTKITVEPSSEAINDEYGNDRSLILAGVAKLTAAHGYAHLTVPLIRSAAGVSRRTFDLHFEDVEDCYLAAVELQVEEALAHAVLAYGQGPNWPGGIHSALRALCEYLTVHPMLATLGFIEAFAPGPKGVRLRARLVSRISALVNASAPSGERMGRLSSEASIGAVWGVLHNFVVSGRTPQLLQIAPTLSYLTLAPTLGAKAASRAIRRQQALETNKK